MPKDKLKIEYLGHSCFRLTYAGQRIVLDPYADGSVPGLGKLRTEAEFVYCSHEHHDHNAVSCVRLKPCVSQSFSVEELETDHDDAGGKLRGKNTTRIFTFGKLRLAHLGDLGRNLSLQEIKRLFGLDMLLIPTGGYYTIDASIAKMIIDELKPESVIPMHYRSENKDYEVLETVDDFLMAFEEDVPNILPLTVGGWVELEK